MDLIPAALAYLARYAASSAHLRMVLHRKVHRRTAQDGGDAPQPADVEAAIDAAVQRMTELDLLNDAEYAASMARQYRNRGESLTRIRARLLAKGLEPDNIAAALRTLDDNEVEAARTYAKRKRLGPFRLSPGKPDQSRRDTAALCRAGFSLSISRQIIETK